MCLSNIILITSSSKQAGTLCQSDIISIVHSSKQAWTLCLSEIILITSSSKQAETLCQSDIISIVHSSKQAWTLCLSVIILITSSSKQAGTLCQSGKCNHNQTHLIPKLAISEDLPLYRFAPLHTNALGLNEACATLPHVYITVTPSPCDYTSPCLYHSNSFSMRLHFPMSILQ